MGRWSDLIRATVARGVTVRRIRLVSEPVTDYIRFEYDVTAAHNIAAGEDVRWLPRSAAAGLLVPCSDFWVLDGQVVLWNHFAATGRGSARKGAMTRRSRSSARPRSRLPGTGRSPTRPTSRPDPASRLRLPPMPTPPSSSSAWQARQALGARLGELREDAGLSGRALARLCGWHESKVSRIEHARTAPSADDIRAWCEHCGQPAETGDLITFLRAVEGMFIEWRRMERTGLRRAQEAVLPLWERTRLFRAYSSWLIPVAVQTSAYTTAVLRAIAAKGTARRCSVVPHKRYAGVQ